jgi:excisionase family DNA binding protein
MTNAESRDPVNLADLPDLPGKITASLAAKMLGVSRQAVHRMAKDKRLRAWRVPSAGQDRPVVVDLAEVLEMQKKRKKVVTVP